MTIASSIARCNQARHVQGGSSVIPAKIRWRIFAHLSETARRFDPHRHECAHAAMSVECTPEEVGLDSARLSNLMPALNNFIEEGELPSGEVLVVGPPCCSPRHHFCSSGRPRRVLVEFGWGPQPGG